MIVLYLLITHCNLHQTSIAYYGLSFFNYPAIFQYSVSLFKIHPETAGPMCQYAAYLLENTTNVTILISRVTADICFLGSKEKKPNSQVRKHGLGLQLRKAIQMVISQVWTASTMSSANEPPILKVSVTQTQMATATLAKQCHISTLSLLCYLTSRGTLFQCKRLFSLVNQNFL